MKKILVILFCAVSLAASAQNKVIGEKSKGIIGEKSVANQQINSVAAAKLRSDIEKQFSDYLKKRAAAEQSADALRKKIEEAMKSLEANDKMGNFEIQNLMSEFNQAETLSSQLHKKREDTKKAVVGKL